MKLMVHVCCGPCAVFPLWELKSKEIELEAYFYNPNIHPIDEFHKRMENAQKLCDIYSIKLHKSDNFLQEKWEAFSGEEAERCNMCYTVRLDEVARFAKEKGFDAFTTTLLVSPYQKHELIYELGKKIGEKYGIEFYYEDFRPGFREGQSKAKELGLYRQKFCGCIISYNQSPFTKKKDK